MHHDTHELGTEGLEHCGYIGQDGRQAVAVWNPSGETVECPRPRCDRRLQSVQTLGGSVDACSALPLGPEDVVVWVFDAE